MDIRKRKWNILKTTHLDNNAPSNRNLLELATVVQYHTHDVVLHAGFRLLP